jgi:hypothetical protein
VDDYLPMPTKTTRTRRNSFANNQVCFETSYQAACICNEEEIQREKFKLKATENVFFSRRLQHGLLPVSA